MAFKEINDPSELPSFASDEEAGEFWSTHKLGPKMLARMKHRDELEDDALPPPREKDIARAEYEDKQAQLRGH